MAPVLFILYVAAVLETFLEFLSRLHLESGVGLHAKYQLEFASSLNSLLMDS